MENSLSLMLDRLRIAGCMLTFGGPSMSFRISNSLWLDFYSRLIRKREEGRVWFGENLISGESSKISIVGVTAVVKMQQEQQEHEKMGMLQ
jgi:hypothetical protein